MKIKKQRCEKELHVEKWFGIPDTTDRDDIFRLTYSDLVDLLYSWESRDESISEEANDRAAHALTLKDVSIPNEVINAAGERIWQDEDGKYWRISNYNQKKLEVPVCPETKKVCTTGFCYPESACSIQEVAKHSNDKPEVIAAGQHAHDYEQLSDFYKHVSPKTVAFVSFLKGVEFIRSQQNIQQ